VVKESSAQLALGAAFGLVPPKEQVMIDDYFLYTNQQVNSHLW